jgi:uncharacterized membrane protein YeaQ/YmgE (transglycosylase-associated protein family)
MEMIAYIIIGLITGLLCWFIVPTFRRIGFVGYLLTGMVGGVAGGMVGGSFNVHKELFAVDVPSIAGAFIGAALVIFVVLGLTRNRAHV